MAAPLLYFYYLCLSLCEKQDENKQKEAGVGPYLKKWKALFDVFCVMQKFLFNNKKAKRRSPDSSINLATRRNFFSSSSVPPMASRDGSIALLNLWRFRKVKNDTQQQQQQHHSHLTKVERVGVSYSC